MSKRADIDQGRNMRLLGVFHTAVACSTILPRV